MKRITLLTSLSLVLTGCTTMHLGRLPARNQVEAALSERMVCASDEGDCSSDVQGASVRWSRCRAVAASEEGKPRALCRFTGYYRMSGGGKNAFGLTCAYFTLADSGAWQIEYYPDADVCEG